MQECTHDSVAMKQFSLYDLLLNMLVLSLHFVYIGLQLYLPLCVHWFGCFHGFLADPAMEELPGQVC